MHEGTVFLESYTTGLAINVQFSPLSISYVIINLSILIQSGAKNGGLLPYLNGTAKQDGNQPDCDIGIDTLRCRFYLRRKRTEIITIGVE